MARIVIEDIKIKKNSKKFIPKEEVFIPRSEAPIKNYIKIEKISHPEKDSPIAVTGIETEKEIEQIIEPIKKPEIVKESKIDEYFKNLSNINQNIQNQRLQRTPQIKTKKRILSKSTIIFSIIAIILAGIYWGGNTYQKADITLSSKHELISYKNKQFLASKDPEKKAVDFEIMITSDKKIKNIILTEAKDVSLKAEGSIILYNEFSTTAQKIVAGTFLSDSEGKSYKTNSTVTIPGYKIINKKIVPGQTIVKISSFLPGDAYNGNPADFYITSFKGTTKYNKIYGKLESPLTGGALGLVYEMNDSDKDNINHMAETSFKEDLLKKVKALVPPGYIFYPEAFTFSHKINERVLSKTPEAEIEINGELSAVLLNEKSLINNILKVSLPEIKSDELKEITIPNLETLSFSFINKDQVINKEVDSISFLLNGNVDVVWNPDIEKLKTKLLGIHKNEVLSIFRQDPGIAGAIVKIFPPWKAYIPLDITKINIILK